MERDSTTDPLAPVPKTAFERSRDAEVAPGAVPFGGWAVAAGQGAAWWTQAWGLFSASPWLWIGVVLTFIVLLFVLALIPFVGQLASTLLYPVLSAGLLVGARDIERGRPLRFGHLFACFDQRVAPLMIAGLLYIAGWFVIWLIAIALCIAVFGLDSLAALADLGPLDLHAYMTFGAVVMLALLIVLALGAPWMMAYWFTPALIAMRGDGPIRAMNASFRASLRNIPPFLVYGIIGLVFALLASVPLGLGWIVLAPVFVASGYVSYRDIFEASERRQQAPLLARGADEQPNASQSGR